MENHNEETIWANIEADGVGIALLPTIKSIIHIGKNPGLDIQVNKCFNRFQKKMLNWCFGWEVEDVKNGS